MFWCTSPFLLTTLVLLPLLSNPVGLTSWLVLGAVEVRAIFVLFGLYDCYRFHWCWRVVGGMVCVGYTAYAVSMLVMGQWFGDGRRSSASVFNALLGFFVFGYPGFMYAVFGRFMWMDESNDCVQEDECTEVELDAGDSEHR